MSLDKYSAVWVSNSSINDFLACRRLYFLRNVYKDPQTRHKINIINPSLALGSAVHEVLEGLSSVPIEERFTIPLLEKYDKAWEKYRGKKGGFKSVEEEKAVKQRGAEMLMRVTDNPGPLLRKAIKIRKNDPNYLPNYFLSEEDNIVLCGRVDWIEYIEEDDSLHIIDFKTGRHDERPDSLQIPIYNLIVSNCQKKRVSRGSYWYLDRGGAPEEVRMPSLEESYNSVIGIAREIKKTRENKDFVCLRGGCRECDPFEEILRGKAEFVGTGTYGTDIYVTL